MLQFRTTTRTTKEVWNQTVCAMIGRGAENSEADVKIVVDYLTRYFGPSVDVNNAAAQEIETQLEIPSQQAEAIVKHRQDRGNFKEWADLEKVSGLDIKKIEPLKNRVTF